jgi:hypothetical protein
MKRYFWKLFLRIGHELVWKADEWFQGQEEKLRKISASAAADADRGTAHIECAAKNNESDDAEYHQNGDYQWNAIPGVGGTVREGSRLRGAGESFVGGESADSNRNREGIVGETQRARTGSGLGNDRARSDAFPGHPRRRNRAKTRLSASAFDDRMRVALAKSRPEMG